MGDLKTFSNPDVPGYLGFANLPNQVHRKFVKKGFEFTLMIVGESGLGKTTLVNSLFLTDLYPERVIPNAADKTKATVKIEASTVEIEERGVKLRLTVVDTPGFGDSINSTDCFQTIIQYIDDQYERYLQDESGLNRRNIVDNRVHCCFYFISPFGHGLKPLDIDFMKQLHAKVNIVPVIAKADTLTRKEVLALKTRVVEQIQEHGIRVYTIPDCDSDEDEEYKEQIRILKASVPFAVCGSNQQFDVKGKKVRGRMYPWGVVEVENPDHCDFIKLRAMLVMHMQDLQEVTQDLHYENYRSERLATKNNTNTATSTTTTTTMMMMAAASNGMKHHGLSSGDGVSRRMGGGGGGDDVDGLLSDKDRLLKEKEEKLREMEAMLSMMKQQMNSQA
ncbi:unnamed protein product [Notodromas monacha]|uniref:Septin n=1 Tax=Notodromas monacha TaxID=399045 RepID=A0A7R9G7N4_9CRUS|nr:unnamed protein product [Notodromas monacha]CAG0912440.1 unnamed protein product [Notodromas monacha]